MAVFSSENANTAKVYTVSADLHAEVGDEMTCCRFLFFAAPKVNHPSVAEDTDAVHRRFLLRADGQTSAKVRDGVSEVSRQVSHSV